jgi:hypothetical protein
MDVHKEYVIALLAALILYLAVTTYNQSDIQLRLGKVEHFLYHQGFDSSHCR